MDYVYTLTQRNSESHQEDFLISSDNLFVILDKMFSVGYCNVEDMHIYVTGYEGDSIPYKEWRKK